MLSSPRKEVPHERCNHHLAALASESSLDKTKVPSLQLGSIQTSRVALLRWSSRHVCSPPGSLQVLLAAVLLDFFARRRMSIQQPDSGPKSDNLLEGLIAELTPAVRNDLIAA